MATTEVYLIRHGIAADRGTYADDNQRPLTTAGVKKTKQVAQRLRSLDLHFDLLLTSPLVRAQQTAEILQAAGLTTQMQISDTLVPEAPIQTWLAWLQGWQQARNGCLALVGHEPDLGYWAETLVWGAARGHLVVKKAGIIGLSVPDAIAAVGNSHLTWLAPPKFLL